MPNIRPRFDAIPGELKPETGAPANIYNVVFNISIFVLALFLTAAALRLGIRAMPQSMNSDSVIGEKIADYNYLPSAPDIVFIGSSRVYRQIDIEALETELERSGCKGVKAYNFGLGGASTLNAKFLLEWIESRKTKPTLVVVEPYGVDVSSALDTNRVFFYAPLFSPRLWVSAYGKKSIVSYVPLLMNFGAFNRLRKKKSAQEHSETHSMVHGFRALDIEVKEFAERRQTLLDILEVSPNYFDEIYNPQQSEFRHFPPIEERGQLFLAGLSKETRRKIVFLIPPPFIIASKPPEQIQIENQGYPLINITPDELPLFLDSKSWFDKGHLNSKGAVIYAKAIAPKLCEQFEVRHAVY